MRNIRLIDLIAILAIVIFILMLPNWMAIGSPTYPLPPPSSQKLIKSYPEKVQNALKNVIGITVKLSPKNRAPFIGQGSISGGTGWMIEPGIFISAGHVLIGSIEPYIKINTIISFDKFGVPSSNYFTYSIIGSSDIENQSKDIILTPRGLGSLEQFADYVAFSSSDYPSALKPLEVDDKLLSIDQTVYDASYIVSHIPVNGRLVVFDVIRKSFAGNIDEVITGFPINKEGVSALYRIETRFEPGFSGGPILNSEGKVVAITVLRTENFNYLYAIPIKDVVAFINKLKRDGAFSQ